MCTDTFAEVLLSAVVARISIVVLLSAGVRREELCRAVAPRAAAGSDPRLPGN
jgi:hypothetical protein